MKSFILALRSLGREWRAGDLRVVASALVVAVACFVSVTAFIDRSNQALRHQASELLAADLVVSTSFAPDPEWARQARRLGLRTTQTTGFRSVVVATERTTLAEVKAVSEGYPLRGALRTAERLTAVDRKTTAIPASGSIWVEAQLLAVLGLQVGDIVALGAREFTITRVITYEPDRGSAVLSIAPRLLMNRMDLDSTGLLQPGSLVHHHLLFAGDRHRIGEFRQWLDQRVEPGITVQDVANARPRFRAALIRGQRFLTLATLVSVVLAAVSIATGARHYANRHLDNAAIMRCFGATQRKITEIYTLQLLTLGIVASVVGCLLGYLGQQAIAELLSGFVGTILPPPSVRPAVAGVAVGLLVLAGFGLPTIIRLKNVPPLRVLRRDLELPTPRLVLLYTPTIIMLMGLILWMTRDAKLAGFVIGGSVGTILVLAVVGYGLIRLASLVGGGRISSWRFAFANLHRRAASSTLQIVSLGLGAMAMLLLTVVRGDLMNNWQHSLPGGTPNHFLINIQPDQWIDIKGFMVQQGLTPKVPSAIVRARLLRINGREVNLEDFETPFAKRVVQRAANLSWTEKLSVDNEVVAGRWWRTDEFGKSLMSVEQDYARTLGLGLGDVLTYRIADREIEFTISSLREVDWDSFRPNFFLLVPPELLDPVAATYITSVYVPRSENLKLTMLIKRFPNVTDIDVGAVLDQVSRVLDRVNHALEYVFLFAIAAGLVVLYAAIQTTLPERQREIAVLRALGADAHRISTSLVTEFATLGMLAGGVGAVGASVTGHILARFVFEIEYGFDPRILPLGIFFCGLIVVLAGTLGTRHLLRTPPWETLQRVS